MPSEFEMRVVEQRAFMVRMAHRAHAPDPESLVHDTILRALRHERLYRQDSNLRGWLLQMMRNVQINQGRQGEVHQRYVIAVETVAIQPTAPSWETDALVLHALDQVPVNFRCEMLLVDLLGFSYSQTALALRIPIGTVMSKLYRARRRFAQIWDELANEESEAA